MIKVLFVVVFSSLINYNEGKTSALILARGGSKGVRLKNLQLVGGRSLLSRAIQTARLAGLDDITVSTDHPLIALKAIRHSAKVFLRSKVAASDFAPSIWGVQEFLAKRDDTDKLALVQATSPFLTKISLFNALRQIDTPVPFDCIFSVTRTFKLRWHINNNQAIPLNFQFSNRPRRQDWAGELYETGAFYIARRKLIENGLLQNDK